MIAAPEPAAEFLPGRDVLRAADPAAEEINPEPRLPAHRGEVIASDPLDDPGGFVLDRSGRLPRVQAAHPVELLGGNGATP